METPIDRAKLLKWLQERRERTRQHWTDRGLNLSREYWDGADATAVALLNALNIDGYLDATPPPLQPPNTLQRIATALETMVARWPVPTGQEGIDHGHGH